ncbi:MAG: alpha/beta fold hydrolase, partial [Planctomycetota bacterium]
IRDDDGGYEESIIDEKHEALPVFRNATFEHGRKRTQSFDALEKRVEVVEDGYPSSYERLRTHPDLRSLAATQRMFLDLYRCMEAAPENGKDTLFFIHGFNYSWTDALVHLQKLHELYVAPKSSPIGRIVYFTWPSWGSLRRYRKDQEIARPSGQLLGRVFGKTVRFYKDFFGEGGRDDTDPRPAFCGGRIHLMAHSMGAQVLTEMVRFIRPYAFLDLPIFGEVLILNADESWRGLEKDRPLFHLPDLAGRIHVYNHESDDALRISEWTKNAEKRLGRHGPRDLNKIPPRTLVVDCSDLNGSARPNETSDSAMLEMARRVLEVENKVDAKERLFDHWGYLNRPEVLLDIHAVLRGESSSEMKKTRERRSERLFRLRDR